MAKPKTRETNESVEAFVEMYVDSEQKRDDSYELIKMMEALTGCPAKMWGPTIIGFGAYHYKYSSGHEGDAPLIGFSPRKKEFSLYVFTGREDHAHLLENLGKFRKGKACIYIKTLSDINLQILLTMMKATINYLTTTYEKN